MSYDFPAHESTRKRRRWGCTCGCVILLIAMAIGGSLLFYLGLKPHQEFPRFTLMDGNVDGFGVVRLKEEDQGVSEFTNYLFRRLEKSKKDTTDANEAKAINVLLKLSKNFLTQFVQAETMVYTNYNPELADENVLVSVPLKNRLSWLVMRQFIQGNVAEKPVLRRGPAEVFPLPAPEGSSSTGTLLSLDPDNLVFSDNESLLLKSLTYASDASHGGSPSIELQRLIDELDLDDPPAGQDLAVTLLNEESRLTNLITVFEEFVGIDGISEQIAGALNAQQLTFDDIGGIRLTADLASTDLLKSELTMYCASQDAVARLTKVFQNALPNVTGKRDGSPFELKGTVVGRGGTVVLSMELSGLKLWIDQTFPVSEAPPAEATPAAE